MYIRIIKLFIVIMSIVFNNILFAEEDVVKKFKTVKNCSYKKNINGEDKYFLDEKFKEKLSFIKKEYQCRDNKEHCKNEVNNDLNIFSVYFDLVNTDEADEITINQDVKNLGSLLYEEQVSDNVNLESNKSSEGKLDGLAGFVKYRSEGNMLAVGVTTELINKGSESLTKSLANKTLWTKASGFIDSGINAVKNSSSKALNVAAKSGGKIFSLGLGSNPYSIVVGATAATIVNLALKKPELKVLGDCPSECNKDANKTSNVCDDRSPDVEYKLFENKKGESKCIPIVRFGNGHNRLFQLSEASKAELLYIDPLFCQSVHDLYDKYKSERNLNLSVKSCPRDFDESIKIEVKDSPFSKLVGDNIELHTTKDPITKRYSTQKMFFPDSPSSGNDVTINWISYNQDQTPKACLLANKSSCLELEELYRNELSPDTRKLNTAKGRRRCLQDDYCYKFEKLGYDNVAKTNMDNIVKNFKGDARYSFYAKNVYIFDHLFARNKYEIETCCALLETPYQKEFMSKHCKKYGPIFNINNSSKSSRGSNKGSN